MLARNKVLTTLGIFKCGIRAEGLFELCDVLKVNTTLTSLDLSDNKFDDANSIDCLGKLVFVLSLLAHALLWLKKITNHIVTLGINVQVNKNILYEKVGGI